MEELFKWVGVFPLVIQVIVLAVLLSPVVVLALLLKRGLRFRGRGNEVALGEGLSNNFSETSPHKSCKYGGDIVKCLTDLQGWVLKRTMVEFFHCPRRIMVYAGQYSDTIMSIFLQVYLHILENKGLRSQESSISYLSYRFLVKDIQRELLNKVEELVRDNGFVDKSIVDFDAYVEQKIDYLVNLSVALFNDWYYYDKDVTREEISMAANKAMPEIVVTGKEFFSCVRRVEQGVKAELLEIDKSIEHLKSGFR